MPRSGRRDALICYRPRMSLRLLILALALTACHPLPPSRGALDESAITAGPPQEPAHYQLYKFLQPIGIETDTFTPTVDGGVEAKAIFTFNDRGSDVPLAAAYRVGSNGLVVRYDAWGDVARGAQLDDHVRALGDGRFDVRRLGAAPRAVRVESPYAVSSGYAPMLGQELLLRTWVARGRPPRLPLLPEGEASIESRGREGYPLDGKTVMLEHLAIRGLVWGREDAWLDEKGKLAAVVTRDAEFDHFEGARSTYTTLIEALVSRAASDALASLSDASRQTGDDAAGPVALVGARLIDGTGAAAVPDAVIVYEGDRILAAGPRATTPVPPGARRVEVQGKTVIPGLWDMHAHIEQVEQSAAYLAAGVTTVRDLGNIMEFIIAIRDAVDSGRGIGPRVIVDGLVDSTAKMGLGTLRVDSEADIAPMIERLVKAHCAELKIYSSLKPSLVAPLAAEAHRRGLRVTGHVPEGMDLLEAIDAGFDGVNHLTSVLSLVFPKNETERRKLSREQGRRLIRDLDLKSPVMERMFARLAERKTLVDPTMALFELFSYPAAELARREPGLAKMPRELRGNYQGIDAENAAWGDARFKKYVAILREMHRRGVPIVAGTDQSVIGHSLHRELEIYVSAGFTPMEALQSATLVPARALKLDAELGTIAAGKRADLLVLDGDPLVDIRNTRTISLVIARGRSYRPADLWRLSGFSP
ncbi:MAG: amidohydrolase [Myxococcales bacterium]|nr:amidohydrolase [Myxococcales bacterium]